MRALTATVLCLRPNGCRMADIAQRTVGPVIGGKKKQQVTFLQQRRVEMRGLIDVFRVSGLAFGPCLVVSGLGIAQASHLGGLIFCAGVAWFYLAMTVNAK